MSIKIKVNDGDGCFDSILRLYNEGFIRDGSDARLIESADDDTIITPTVEFVRQTGVVNTEEGQDLRIREDGATWFREIRGDHVEIDNNAAWMNLIEQIRTQFHKNYSWLEYNTSSSRVSSKTLENDKALITKILDRIWPWSDRAEIIPSDSPGAMHIFGAGLRLDITNAGEPVSVIGHIYFSRASDGTLIPLRHDAAKNVHTMTQTFDSTDNIKVPKDSERSQTVGKILLALETLFKRKKNASADADGLEDWLYIANESDDHALHLLADQGHGKDGEVPLSCTYIELLNVVHMSQPTRLYYINLNGKNIMNVEFSMDQDMNFTCELCNDKYPMIENASLRLKEGRPIKFNFTAEDLGVTDEDVANSVCKTHLAEIVCDVGCSSIKCNGGYFEAGGRNYCEDCPRREVIYIIGETKYPTVSLAFDNATLSLVPSKNENNENSTRTCRFCQRSYVGLSNAGICDFCAGRTLSEDAAIALYHKYSRALPLQVRLKATRKRKVCYEDNELIMFMIGDENPERYYCNKYGTVNPKALSASPKKMK